MANHSFTLYIWTNVVTVDAHAHISHACVWLCMCEKLNKQSNSRSGTAYGEECSVCYVRLWVCFEFNSLLISLPLTLRHLNVFACDFSLSKQLESNELEVFMQILAIRSTGITFQFPIECHITKITVLTISLYYWITKSAQKWQKVKEGHANIQIANLQLSESRHTSHWVKRQKRGQQKMMKKKNLLTTPHTHTQPKQ